METAATGQPRARQSPPATQRLGRQQTGHRAGLDLGGNFPALLELSLADLGALLPGLLDLAGLAQPNRADDESRPHAARPPGTAPELVPRQAGAKAEPRKLRHGSEVPSPATLAPGFNGWRPGCQGGHHQRTLKVRWNMTRPGLSRPP